MQKDDCFACRDGQDNKVDPHCNSTSVQGDVLTCAIPSCGLAWGALLSPALPSAVFGV